MGLCSVGTLVPAVPIGRYIKSFFSSPHFLLPLRGVNVVPFLEMIGLPESLVGLLRDSSSGYALTAYAMYKVI